MSDAPTAPLRYSLLRHTGAPDDPSGCHYDLLLEDGEPCRGWRLPAIPARNGAHPGGHPAASSGAFGWSPAVPLSRGIVAGRNG